MVKISFQQIVDNSFQSLEALEAQQKLRHIRVCERALQKLEEELDAFIENSRITVDNLNRGSSNE